MLYDPVLLSKLLALVLHTIFCHIQCPRKIHTQDPFPLGREWPDSECLTFKSVAGTMNSVQVPFKEEDNTMELYKCSPRVWWKYEYMRGNQLPFHDTSKRFLLSFLAVASLLSHHRDHPWAACSHPVGLGQFTTAEWAKAPRGIGTREIFPFVHSILFLGIFQTFSSLFPHLYRSLTASPQPPASKSLHVPSAHQAVSILVL